MTTQDHYTEHPDTQLPTTQHPDTQQPIAQQPATTPADLPPAGDERLIAHEHPSDLVVDPPVEYDQEPPVDYDRVPADREAPIEHESLGTDTVSPADVPPADVPPADVAPAVPSSERDSAGALFGDSDLSGFRSHWDEVQATFVDDPQQCVRQADALVSDVVQKVTSGFSDTRSRLEAQWASGNEASTEDLRVALKQYREFFQRLLTV